MQRSKSEAQACSPLAVPRAQRPAWGQAIEAGFVQALEAQDHQTRRDMHHIYIRLDECPSLGLTFEMAGESVTVSKKVDPFMLAGARAGGRGHGLPKPRVACEG